MVRDSYCGIRTCDLLVSVLIQGTPRSAVGWGTSQFPGQLIALLLVAQWLERWCVGVLIRGKRKGSRLGHLGISRPTYCQPSGPGSILAVSLKSAVAKHHHSNVIYMLMIIYTLSLWNCP